MDDPLVIASLLPPNIMLEAQNLRWTLCATDRCFRNPVTSAFFKHVKVLPVSRGDGIYQKVFLSSFALVMSVNNRAMTLCINLNYFSYFGPFLCYKQ